MLALLLLACAGHHEDDTGVPAPFGMPLRADGQLYAGVARVDITPAIPETYQDLDGDAYFDGCTNDPSASRPGCEEPFDDADGDGEFDAVWMGGWGGGGRAARDVHDPLWVTALVLALDGEYVALVSVDAVGLLEYRTTRAREALGAQGFEADRVIVAADHTHQGPDTVGLWGDLDALVTGLDAAYQEELEGAVVDAVATAAAGMEAVRPSQGAVRLAELDPAYNGAPFGGTNPNPGMLGLVHDGRDPIVVDDQVLTLALDTEEGRLVTLVSYSSHPEVVGYQNESLSADYVYFLRDRIERTVGGTPMFLASAVGGMQSAWNGTLPLVDEAGERVLDEEGAPVFIDAGGWDYARSEGVLVADAALGTPLDPSSWERIEVRHAPVLLPISNVGFEVALRMQLLDQPWETLVQDTSCPGHGEDPQVIGCLATGVWRVDLGPVSLGTVPGELLPELFDGAPDERAVRDAAARSGDGRWPHHPAACDDASWEVCRVREADGDCDCTEMHAAPYTLAFEGGAVPLRTLLPGKYRAVVGLANGYVGYVIPEPDYSLVTNALTGLEGNHSEEWYSAGEKMAPVVQEGWRALGD